MILFLAVGFILVLLLVIVTAAGRRREAQQAQAKPPLESRTQQPEPMGLAGSAKLGFTIDSAEVADQVAKAVRVREATYAALRKKKEQRKDSAGHPAQQDPAVPPGQRAVKKYALPSLPSTTTLTVRQVAGSGLGSVSRDRPPRRLEARGGARQRPTQRGLHLRPTGRPRRTPVHHRPALRTFNPAPAFVRSPCTYTSLSAHEGHHLVGDGDDVVGSSVRGRHRGRVAHSRMEVPHPARR
jgi:hypothetical protein